MDWKMGSETSVTWLNKFIIQSKNDELPARKQKVFHCSNFQRFLFWFVLLTTDRPWAKLCALDS